MPTFSIFFLFICYIRGAKTLLADLLQMLKVIGFEDTDKKSSVVFFFFFAQFCSVAFGNKLSYLPSHR